MEAVSQYQTTTSRIYKGKFAPTGKRYVICQFKWKDRKFEAINICDIAILNPTTIPIVGAKLYKFLCEKYNI